MWEQSSDTAQARDLQSSTDQGDGKVSINEAPPGWPPDERHHRKHEKVYWYGSLAFSMVAAFGAIAVAIFTGSYLNAAWHTYGETKKQTRIINDQERRQLRAYVYAVPSVANFAVGQYPTISVTLKNGGQTPAYNPSFGMSWRIGPDRLIGTTFKNLNSEMSTPTFTPDGTGQFIYQDHTLVETMPAQQEFLIPQAAYDAIMTAKAYQIYVWGRVEYLDAFGDVWHTNFCFSFSPTEINANNNTSGYCPSGNDAN